MVALIITGSVLLLALLAVLIRNLVFVKKELQQAKERQQALQKTENGIVVLLERLGAKVERELESLNQIKTLIVKEQTLLGDGQKNKSREIEQLEKNQSGLLKRVETLEAQKTVLLKTILDLKLKLKQNELFGKKEDRYTENSQETQKSQESQSQ